MNSHFDKNSFDQIDSILNQYANGYLVIIDIKDSTARKKEYKQLWMQQTIALFKGFENFADRIKAQTGMEIAVIKFMGDGGMVFFEHSPKTTSENDAKADPENSTAVLEELSSFIREVKDQSNKLGKMRLRTVLTYLTDVFVFDLSGKKDVIGRGVDFSFRLEKFADISHITVNKLFYNSLSQNTRGYKEILCKRKVKGWSSEGGEEFYILTSESDIEEAFKGYRSPSSAGDVNMELFEYYVSLKEGACTESLKAEDESSLQYVISGPLGEKK